MSNTIFDKIVRGEMDAYKVWEDDNHLAFLTPFPSTPGLTVVIPKTNQSDYVFDLEPQQLTDLMLAAQKVAKLLERALQVPKVGLVFEGEGVAYVHAKLYPMHKLTEQSGSDLAGETVFFDAYPGYLTTIEGPKMDDAQLQAIQTKIREADK